jgi:hypothetical protein
MNIVHKPSTGASRETASMALTWINAEDLGEALRRSRRLYRAQPKVITGLNKAALELMGGATWSYDLTEDVLVISSATRAGVTYEVAYLSCSCPAGSRIKPVVCWHSYARDLITFAIQIGFEKTMPPKEILALDDAAYEAMLAAADEMFG